MIELIPNEKPIKRCHYCDTFVGVKYRIHTKELDRVYYGMDGYVYCCKRCAEKHYVGNKADIEE